MGGRSGAMGPHFRNLKFQKRAGASIYHPDSSPPVLAGTSSSVRR
jgi:hypothetical protein